MIRSIRIVNGFLTQMPNFHPGKTFEFTDGVNAYYGSNGCLAEGTKILTTTGIKNIEHIQVGDFVYNENGIPIKVLHHFNTGIKKVVELKSDRIVWAESSYDHVWLSRHKGPLAPKTRSLMVNDFLKNHTPIKRLYNISQLGKIDEPQSYLLGAMLGDGCCKELSKNRLYVSNAHEEVVNRIGIDSGGTYKKLSGNNFTWNITIINPCKLYEEWCYDKYAHEKIVDLDIVKGWNRISLLNFVAGIMDTDGCFQLKRRGAMFCSISMQSKSVIDALEYAFLALWGMIGSRSIDNRPKYKNGPCHTISFSRSKDLYITLLELKDYLQVQQKRNIILKSKIHTSDDVFIGLMKGKERLSQTYDIHVDSDTNLYCLANGLVTHNSGKTVLLKMLKAYCGIERGGWSQISSHLALGAKCKEQFPWVYRAYSPASSDCVVDWDGIASFYNDGDIKIDQWAWFSNKEILSEDGMTTESEQFQYLMDKPSSGQYRLIKLNKMLNMLKNPPDLAQCNSGHYAQRAEIDYIRSLPRNGKPTLILDEPERALSLPKQLELFKLLQQMTEKYQIIIATHSPFVLFEKDINIFDIEPGYAEECVKIIKERVESTLNS